MTETRAQHRRLELEVARGPRIPVMLRATLGSTSESDFFVPSNGVLRLEMQLGDDDALELGDQGSRPPLEARGARQHRVRVAPGDTFTAGGESFTVVETSQSFARAVELEAALHDAPDDEARWAVYADWLLERDDPLARFTEVDSLDTLLLERRLRSLEVELKHGFIVGATFHGRSLPAPSPAAVVRTLGGLPAARFLRRLHVNAARTLMSFPGLPTPAEQLRTAVESIRDALSARGPWLSLRELEVGPLWDRAGVERLRPLLADLPSCPRLETPPAERFVCYGGAWLSLAGAGERLRLDRTTLFALGNMELRFGAEGWNVALASQQASAGLVLVNGQRIGFLGRLLSPGDSIEQPGVFLAVFHAEVSSEATP